MGYIQFFVMYVRHLQCASSPRASPHAAAAVTLTSSPFFSTTQIPFIDFSPSVLAFPGRFPSSFTSALCLCSAPHFPSDGVVGWQQRLTRSRKKRRDESSSRRGDVRGSGMSNTILRRRRGSSCLVVGEMRLLMSLPSAAAAAAAQHSFRCRRHDALRQCEEAAPPIRAAILASACGNILLYRSPRAQLHGRRGALFTPLRRCHNSAADNSHGLSSSAGPSPLLQDLLRRLDEAGGGDVNVLSRHAADAAAPNASPVPTDGGVRGEEEKEEKAHRTMSGYVPLLFRADFVQSAARRRQQLTGTPFRQTESQPSEATSATATEVRSSGLVGRDEASASIPGGEVHSVKLTSHVVPSQESDNHLSTSVAAGDSGKDTQNTRGGRRSQEVSAADVPTEEEEVEKSQDSNHRSSSNLLEAPPQRTTVLADVYAEEELEYYDLDAAPADEDKRHITNSQREEEKAAVVMGEAAENDGAESEEEAATTAAAATPRRVSRKLILDPVEWLAQAAEAPLMDSDLLHSRAPVQDHLFTLANTSPSHTRAFSEMEMGDGDGSSARSSRNMVGTAERTDASDALAEPAFLDREDDGMAPPFVSRASEEQEAELLADLLSDIPRPRRPRKKKTPPQKEMETHRTAADPLSDATPAQIPQADTATATQVAASTTDTSSTSPTPHQSDDNDDDATHRSAAAAGNASTADAEALVYNVFTRRVAKASSPSIRMLALMGVGVDSATRELRLTDPEALESLAAELRAQRISWPQLWSRGGLYRQIERVLSDASIRDVAAHVSSLLQLQYNKSHLQHQRPGLVVADTQSSSSSGGVATTADDHPPHDGAAGVDRGSTASPAAAAAPMAERFDDKLITLQDLNEEQQAVVELILQGHHTYIGGGAGTGKSVLLRIIKQQLVREGLAVAVTGTTGIAGTQIGGSTLHHCLGINVSGEFTRRKDLSSYDVIIIDEVSMLSRELFESLEVHLRRANNANLPFGGIQVILCGDFLQLGAIDSRPLITSPLFRRYFVQLKLRTVVRQNQNLRFAAQLQQLRRGRVPADLANSVAFVTRQQILAERRAELALRERQQQQLKALALASTDTASTSVENTSETAAEGQPPPQPEAGVSHSEQATESAEVPASTGPVTPFVEGAVNLLPTNREVNLTNAQQLQQLPGELVTYVPQFLPPSLVGSWSQTFVLRIYEPSKLQRTLLRMELMRYLATFYTHGQRASPQSAANVSRENFSDGEWLLNPTLGERSVVLYPLFVDALAFRVRLPLTMDPEEARQFLLHLAQLDRHLETEDHGVRVREILTHGDGMHTEQDEYILSQYAARAPLAHTLDLKIGARVMLRTNFAPGLVNGSLGTVVGFRKLVVEELPRYLLGNTQREEAILQYSDFLQYEQGFQVPMVPVVDFNGRQIPIPPMTQYVGGLPNTHHYSMGITALPLSLAYAFTVHKVQGLTLVGRVHLELSRMWPCEHLLYVAMSRVRNPEQLSVSSFHPSLVRAAADCLLFDDSLPSVWEAKIAPYMIAATWYRAPERRKKVLLKKKLESYVKQRRRKLLEEAGKGDVQAEIRLLEERMLRQRAQAAARTKEKQSNLTH